VKEIYLKRGRKEGKRLRYDSDKGKKRERVHDDCAKEIVPQ
jgi:hypothetical protein